jgi:hypothetical protein
MIYLSAAQSAHIVDVSMLRLGLHRRPGDLQMRLQAEIDSAQGQGYDAIVLAYGLCGKATHGLTARDVPLVVPRAHDCITLFLGSRARYSEQHENKPGTYWYAQDYIERGSQGGEKVVLGSTMDDGRPIEEVYDEYVQKYGQDNADYLMEVMGAWRAHYQRAAYIDMGIGDGKEVEASAMAEAERRGWAFERLAGDMVLIRKLLNGEWDGDFLVLKPGERLEMSYNADIICPG